MQKFNRRNILVNSVAAFAVTGLGQLPSSAFAHTDKEHTVTIKKFKFDPEHIEVFVGDTITWTNQDIAPHTATGDEKDWGTGKLKKGQSKTLTVTEDMATSYFCKFHPHMKASITIKAHD